MEAIERYDPRMYLYWNADMRYWTVYRIAQYGTTPGADALRKEFDLRTPARKGGGGGNGHALDWSFFRILHARKATHLDRNPKRHAKALIDSIEREEARQEESMRRERIEYHANLQHDMEMCRRGQTSVNLDPALDLPASRRGRRGGRWRK